MYMQVVHCGQCKFPRTATYLASESAIAKRLRGSDGFTTQYAGLVSCSYKFDS